MTIRRSLRPAETPDPGERNATKAVTPSARPTPHGAAAPGAQAATSARSARIARASTKAGFGALFMSNLRLAKRRSPCLPLWARGGSDEGPLLLARYERGMRRGGA